MWNIFLFWHEVKICIFSPHIYTGYGQLSQHHLSNGCCSLLTCTAIFVPYQVSICMYVSINLFCSFGLFLYTCTNTTLLNQLYPYNQPHRARFQALPFCFDKFLSQFYLFNLPYELQIGLLNSLKTLFGILNGVIMIHRSIINLCRELVELHSYIF